MDKEQIEFVFYNYLGIAKAVEEKRLDPRTEKTGGCGHCKVSDPTANKAVANCEPVSRVKVGEQIVRDPEKWLKVVRETRTFYKRSLRGELIRRRYDMQENRKDTCFVLKMSLARYHNLVNEVLEKALEVGDC